MLIGEARDWNELFEQSLVPRIISHVLSTWSTMEKPGQDELEPAISYRLYCALVRAKDRSAHPFLIRYEDVEVDTHLASVAGRKDIVFYPCTEEAIYFCLEAKRLNALISGRQKSLASEYVKEGMQRFVDRRYARSVRHGGMLGYILDGQVERAIKNVENNLHRHHGALGMGPSGRLQPSSLVPGASEVRETRHRRHAEPGEFLIHHIFLACSVPENHLDG